MLILLVFASILSAREATPLDTLYSMDSLSFGMKTVLKPIQWWQHISYNSSALNCQFEHSCSNFMVDAILQKGIVAGAIAGTDRIVRCNPAARHYHLHTPGSKIQYDGRLVEPLNWTGEVKPGKNVPLATSLSIIPGLGRAYAGHPVDGFFSFLIVASFANNTYRHAQMGNSVRAGINGAIMTLFWAADFYGAYRTAKLTPPED
ncbi:MAG: membrane protein insertion efficiency factor YidD [Candidatus Marinimicrobia bacterium]|nr:membrane protein insertion efficiency factor YidD [Candidatus Neomarinimicrobiota bacterium]